MINRYVLMYHDDMRIFLLKLFIYRYFYLLVQRQILFSQSLNIIVNLYRSMPPKKPTSQPLFISIEGNIGSGKSTILKIIREKFTQLQILDQPLTEWQNVGQNKNINLLEMYYKDSKRWGFTFQIFAFMSRLMKWAQYSKIQGQGINISQRSLLSDRYIFASIMRDMDILDQAQHEVYLQLYDHLVAMNNIVDLFGVIYIQCAPQICEKRIKMRSRQGQSTIPLDYLTRIHEKHQSWLTRNNGQDQKENILIINNTNPINTQEIISMIQNWLTKRNKTLSQ